MTRRAVSSEYPAGTFGGDPSAPWNEVEGWRSETCGSCRWLRKVFNANGDETGTFVCSLDPALLVRCRERDRACEDWD